MKTIRTTGVWSTILTVAVMLASASSLAAERTFTKAEAIEVAASLVPALPAAPPGWKIDGTYAEAEIARRAGRDIFVPMTTRTFVGPSGKRRLSLIVMYGYRLNFERMVRQYQDASGRAKRGVEIRKIEDFTLYLYGDRSWSEYFMRVGSFAVMGGGRDTDLASVIGLLEKIDFGRLKAVD